METENDGEKIKEKKMLSTQKRIKTLHVNYYSVQKRGIGGDGPECRNFFTVFITVSETESYLKITVLWDILLWHYRPDEGSKLLSNVNQRSSSIRPRSAASKIQSWPHTPPGESEI